MAQSVWLKSCIDYYLCFACIDEQRETGSTKVRGKGNKAKANESIRLLLRHRIGLSAIKMVVKCSGMQIDTFS